MFKNIFDLFASGFNQASKPIAARNNFCVFSAQQVAKISCRSQIVFVFIVHSDIFVFRRTKKLKASIVAAKNKIDAWNVECRHAAKKVSEKVAIVCARSFFNQSVDCVREMKIGNER